MKYLVAVSGGVDSVVLLHKLVTSHEHELIVAHFDHGIRSDSAADARFVEALAISYGLEYIGQREELGTDTSEEFARYRRYHFLVREARERKAVIVTAHHADDVVETVALNLTRGTGWRGLAVLAHPALKRPLLHTFKQELYEYALEKKLEWVEDNTNALDIYLRNRLRRRIGRGLISETRRRILRLWQQQCNLALVIDSEIKRFIRPDHTYSRYFFNQIDHVIGVELIRAITKQRLTRPQAERALLAIKTAHSGSTHQASGNVMLRFDLKTFVVETP